MSDPIRRAASLCWHCDRLVDAISPVNDVDTPSEGAVCLCLYCGAIATIGPDLRLDKPTKEFLEHLRGDNEFMVMFARFSWARQFVMIEANLLGSEAEGYDDR